MATTICTSKGITIYIPDGATKNHFIEKETQPVVKKKPSGIKIYDCHGNEIHDVGGKRL